MGFLTPRFAPDCAVEFIHEFDDTRDGALPEGLEPLPLYAMAAYLELPVLMARVAEGQREDECCAHSLACLFLALLAARQLPNRSLSPLLTSPLRVTPRRHELRA